MKLTVEFNSYQELNDFMSGVAIAPALLEIEKSEETKEVVKVEKTKKTKKVEDPKDEPKVEEAPEEEPAAEIMPAPVEEKKYSIEDVRAVLGKLQKAGKKEEVKELIASFGVDKLSQVKEEDYAALIEKAGEI